MISIQVQTCGDTLYFYVVTTKFDTGVATDADAAPSYRIYHRENGTAITNGTMALLDSANTAGFYSEAVVLTAYDPGEYVVFVAATVNSVAGATCGAFSIGSDAILVRTTIATLASQTSFTLTAGPAENDAINGCIIIIRDVASVDQFAVGVVGDYTGSTKTVTLLNDPAIFTMATTDFVTVIADRALKATVDNRTFDVSSTGEGGVDWANVGSPTTTVGLSGTTVKTATDIATDVAAVKVDTAAILVDTGTTLDVRIPAALVGGRMDSSVGAIAANVITAASIATDAIDADALAADAVTEIQAGLSTLTAAGVWTYVIRTLTDTTISTLTAANVWEYATRSLTTPTFPTNFSSLSIDGSGRVSVASIATDAVNAAALAADAVSEIDAGISNGRVQGTTGR